MERITNLLFVTTALFIFSVLVIFEFNVAAGNGGEYWGFDGRIPPRRAARFAFEANEKRFLAYSLDTEFRGEVSGAPNAHRCDFHPGIRNGHLRFNQIEARHGYDSERKAEAFAHEFHFFLGLKISEEGERWCEPAGID